MTVLLALHVVCGGIILALLLRQVPQFEKVFKDFDMQVPEMSILVINLSRFFALYFFLLVPGIAMADIAVLVLLNRSGQVGLMTVWGVLIWLAEMLLIALIVLAMMVPMNALTTRLAQ